jgi:hypothetical protein
MKHGIRKVLFRPAIAIALASLATFALDAHAATPGTVPKSLVDAAERSENIYDDVSAQEWNRANRTLQSLRQATTRMRAEVAQPNTTEMRVDAALAPLTQAIFTQDQLAAMTQANQITRDVATLTAAYAPAVPLPVTLLDYYGRELEIWSQAQDIGRLQVTAAEMRRQWDMLRPAIEARGSPEAGTFEALVAQVEQARTPAEYARMAKPVLDEVDQLEKVFNG